jgi:Cd2+/Zn2+-exporting ATPase/Cu+-exporting ATPase
VGIISLADQLRTEVPLALTALREQGYKDILLLTGDNRAATTPIAQALNLDYRADLMPDDKIAIVQEYQERGKVVAMIGDGVNDAPALAQADVGIAMGAAGADIAIQAADIALLRDDWAAVPAIFTLSHRTMDVVRLNLIFTAIYNIIGLALASFGLIPPALAAAAQSLPDVGILANSSRLLRFKASEDMESSNP